MPILTTEQLAWVCLAIFTLQLVTLVFLAIVQRRKPPVAAPARKEPEPEWPAPSPDPVDQARSRQEREILKQLKPKMGYRQAAETAMRIPDPEARRDALLALREQMSIGEEFPE